MKPKPPPPFEQSFEKYYSRLTQERPRRTESKDVAAGQGSRLQNQTRESAATGHAAAATGVPIEHRAGPFKRACAAAIDVIIFIFAMLAAAFIGMELDVGELKATVFPDRLFEESMKHFENVVVASLYTYFAYGAIQIWLNARYGQSIGKKICNTRVVKQDGTDAGFLVGVVVRTWLVPTVLCALPPLGIVSLAWIFGRENRCLHDVLAKTDVIDLTAQTARYPKRRHKGMEIAATLLIFVILARRSHCYRLLLFLQSKGRLQ
jgi:uncharacterized RDD family membrane protein YckC